MRISDEQRLQEGQHDFEEDMKFNMRTAGKDYYNGILMKEEERIKWEDLPEEERESYCRIAFLKIVEREKRDALLKSKGVDVMERQLVGEVGMTKQKTQDITLISKEDAKDKLRAIVEFQTVVQSQMQKDKDYGIIPGTNKPTLLKPGAEKLAKLMNLSDTYEIIEKTENWDKPFFNYTVRCSLNNINSMLLVSSGLGSCNSFESKYRWRWVFENDIPTELDAKMLKTKVIHSNKNNKDYTMYRIENDDIFSQVNTLLKMAKKRALVDAALSAGRLSDIFTQDMEDMKDNVTEHHETSTPVDKPVNKPASAGLDTRKISQPQDKRLHAIANNKGWNDNEVRQVMITRYKIEHSSDLMRHQYNEACDIFENSIPEQYFGSDEEEVGDFDPNYAKD